MFNDYWMNDQGFLERERFGDLRDLISRRAEDRAVVSVAPDDDLLIAYQPVDEVGTGHKRPGLIL